MIRLKVLSNWVRRKSSANVSWGSTVRVSSITSRMPRRSDSSRRSVMPSMRPSRTNWAMRSMRLLLLTW
jgi:hypothetical protein